MTTSRSSGQTEHEIQRAFISWARQTYPHLWVFAVPNGGGRSASQGARLKVEGVSPGVPDVFCPALLLWIEFKKPGGRVSPEQAAWHEHLASCGYDVAVCYSVEAAQRAFIPLAESSLLYLKHYNQVIIECSKRKSSPKTRKTQPSSVLAAREP